MCLSPKVYPGVQQVYIPRVYLRVYNRCTYQGVPKGCTTGVYTQGVPRVLHTRVYASLLPYIPGYMPPYHTTLYTPTIPPWVHPPSSRYSSCTEHRYDRVRYTAVRREEALGSNWEILLGMKLS